MNVKELKKLAEEWGNTSVGSVQSADAAWAMYQAIMALPDDPHQDLVEMARSYIAHTGDLGFGRGLASAVIDRFGKREPRKVEKLVVMRGDLVAISNFDEEHARKFVREHPGEGYWLARLTGTEEV